ncbi:MAG: hypothetical protein A3F43_04025 [Gammaproteobacteria bacterium RIFCSPHIGHO2_12_FULL_42_10]|nr:MAG: hypothetical protein A3F43_04025 [Gammaproteobacteria bacterium RIFCSPHIGHO2_12_FULL_42_10]
MRLLRLTNYLLGHRAIAILLVFCITFVPMIGIIGILYAGLITLRKGIIEGGIFTLAATLPYVASFYLSGGHAEDAPLIILAAIGIAVLSNVLTWIFASMLKRQVSWSNLIQIAALMGVLFVSIAHLINPSIAAWWGAQLQLYYTKAAALTSIAANKALVSPETQLETIAITKQYATGLMTMAILFNAILQLIVARWWQAAMFYPGLLRRELHTIRLSQLASGLFVLGLIFAYLGNSVALDIMPILYMLFGMAGLSLIHYLFGLLTQPTKWFWLWLMYIAFFISLPTSLLLVGIFALADAGFDIRHRVKKV